MSLPQHDCDAPQPIDWKRLEELANLIDSPAFDPNSLTAEQMALIDETVSNLVEHGCLAELVRVRKLFTLLYSRDAITNQPALNRLDEAAISAAKEIGDLDSYARFLGARAHNLHRQGYHAEAIAAFTEAERCFLSVDEAFEALKAHYMIALCKRALGQYRAAEEIVDEVLGKVQPDNLWRGNPMQVKAWLLQDKGDLAGASEMLEQAIDLQRQMANGDILVANSLSDLAELMSLRGRLDEAMEYSRQALEILARFPGQYRRQEAYAWRKRGEIQMRAGQLADAEASLRTAAELASGQYYDLLWRIELYRAWLYLWTGRPRYVIAKVRSALEIRRGIGLSNQLLLRQSLGHLWQRIRGLVS